MNAIQSHLPGHHTHGCCDSARARDLLRPRPLPLQQRALAPIGGTGWSPGRCTILLLAAAVMLGGFFLGHTNADAAANLPLGDLGARICAPHGSECLELWNVRTATSDTFMTLVAAMCLYLRYEVHELDGIVCLETVIDSARSLPAGLLTGETNTGGEDGRHESRPSIPDPYSPETVSSYLEGLPAFCDRITPVILEYFDCLLRELQTIRFTLRHRHQAACSVGASRSPTKAGGCGIPATQSSVRGVA